MSPARKLRSRQRGETALSTSLSGFQQILSSGDQRLNAHPRLDLAY